MTGPTTAPEVYRSEGICVIEGLVPPPVIEFLIDYLQVRGAAGALVADVQVPGSPALYGDPAFDTLMDRVADPISRLVAIDLVPTYSFVRVYRPGDELAPHVDRAACEHSVTLHLGASDPTPWPVHLTTLTGRTESVSLRPGDAVVYQGPHLRHWRQPCRHEWYAQTFLHFVDAAGAHAHERFDGRDALGTPKRSEVS